MDVELKETLLDRFYERSGLPYRIGWTIVDIGVGIDDYTIFAAHGREQARVMAFEPFPDLTACCKTIWLSNKFTMFNYPPKLWAARQA
jgi:hypothetical protein